MPAINSVEEWNDAVHKICGDFSTQHLSKTPFIGNIELQTHDSLGIAHIETNANRIHRKISSHQNDQFCFLIYQTQGIMGFQNEIGTEFQLAPGELALVDSAQSFSMLPQGLISQISVHLPRASVIRKLRHQSFFGKLSQNSVGSQVLRNMLQQLRFSETPFGSQSGDGQALQNALTELLPSALAREEEQLSDLPLRQVAERHILNHLNDYRLSPEFVAEEMNISKRKLYRLFEAEGVSVARHILELRLEHSKVDLANQSSDSLSVTDIAFKWGFSDISQFSRAFKRSYGISPRAFRQNTRVSALQ